MSIFIHIAALLSAVIIPTVLMSLQAGTLGLAPLILVTAFPSVIFIGVPIYLTLRLMKWVNMATCALGGFAAAAMPIGVLTWPLRYPELKTTASIDGVATIIDGVPTAAGWALFAGSIIRYALLGAIGGVAFWGALKATGGLATQPHYTRNRVIAVFTLTVVALSGMGMMLSQPNYTKDRSCHGNYEMPIGVRIDLQVPDSEWGAVTDLLQNYAAAHQLSFRNSSEVRPHVRLLYLSLCDDSRIRVMVNEQRWASRGYRNAMAGRGIRDSHIWPTERTVVAGTRSRPHRRAAGAVAGNSEIQGWWRPHRADARGSALKFRRPARNPHHRRRSMPSRSSNVFAMSRSARVLRRADSFAVARHRGAADVDSDSADRMLRVRRGEESRRGDAAGCGGADSFGRRRQPEDSPESFARYTCCRSND